MVRKYLQKFNEILYKNRFAYFFLFIISVLLFELTAVGIIKYLLIPLFFFCYFLYILQSIFLIKRSYFLYLSRLLILIFLIVEIFFAVKNQNNTIIQFNAKYFIIGDSIIGWKNAPNAKDERCTLGIGKDTVYDVYYSTDSLGRRITSNFCKNPVYHPFTTTKHAIFVGCSFTFGVGLNDTSTFPCLYGSTHTDYQVYNYGVGGYGPHQICLLFDEGINTINKESVPEDSGFCLYTYIDDHMNRVYGHGGNVANKYGNPDIFISKNKLIRKMKSAYIYWFLNNSGIKQYFHLNFSYPKTEAFYKRFY